MIDLHCHVLPGIDDGPATREEAVALARAHVAAGVHTVVATPHVHHDYPANTGARIAEAVADLRGVLEQEGVPLAVVAGAEVSLTRSMDLAADELDLLRLGDGPWMLVEPPFTPTASSSIAEALFRLQARGHRVVIAHPERCPAFQQDRELLAQCVERGMLASITAGSLVGRFGRTVQRLTLDLMHQGLVHDVASDAHSVRRPPGMAQELADAGFAEHVDRLCRDAPAAILTGTTVPEAPVIAERRGVLGRLLRRG